MSRPGHALQTPPTDDRKRELWLQHGAGLIIFRDARQTAIDSLDPNLDDEAKKSAITGIDAAIYGFMQIFDGVSGSLSNDQLELVVEGRVVLRDRETGAEIEAVEFVEGDGMCMGYHAWMDGDFGSDAIVD